MRISVLLPAVIAATLSAAVSAQTPVGPPRTAWGAPDLVGIWDFRTMTPLERPRDLADTEVWSEEEAAAYEAATLERRQQNPLAPTSVHAAWWLDNGTELTPDRRTSLIVDPPDGRIPAMTPEARQRQEDHGLGRPVRLRQSRNTPAHGPEDLGVGERCLSGFSTGPPITPSAYNNNLMVFQTPDHVVLFTEMVHEARVVPLDGRPHLPASVRQWLGDSRGRWEGDTLVIESTNFTDRVGSFNTLGMALGTGDTLHLTERLTRVDEETLLYEFTVTDPDTFVAPFSAAVPMKRTDVPLYEFACHEGNRGLEGILRGARAEERSSR
mgnify:CR=1 FL=1